MDLWIAIHPNNASRMVAVLTQFGFSEEQLSKELFLKEKQVIRLGVPPLRIEILTSISGVDFEECYTRRKTAKIDGVKINLISLADLKENKKASGRLKDLNDLENLP